MRHLQRTLIHATNWNVTGGTSHTEWSWFFFLVCYYGAVMPFRLSWIGFLFDHKERTERLSSIKKITTNWQHNWISVHFNVNWSRCRSLIVLVKVFLYSFCFVFIQNELDKCVNVIFVQSFINFAERCHQSLFSVRGPVSVLNFSLSLVFNTNIKYLLHFSSTLYNKHFQVILCITQKIAMFCTFLFRIFSSQEHIFLELSCCLCSNGTHSVFVCTTNRWFKHNFQMRKFSSCHLFWTGFST